MGERVAGIFDVLSNDVASYKNERETFEIHYDLLGKGDWNEVRYVLGKVIMETMSSGITQKHQPRAANDEHCILETNINQQQQLVQEKWPSTLTGLEEQSAVARDKRQHFEVVGEKGECCQGVVRETENYFEEGSKEKLIMKALKEEKFSQEAVKKKVKKQCQEAVEKNKRKFREAVNEENKCSREVVKEQQKYHEKAAKKQKLCQEATRREEHQQEVKANAKHHIEATKDKEDKDQSHLSGLEKQEVVKERCDLPQHNLEPQQQETVKEQMKQCRPLSSLFM